MRRTQRSKVIKIWRIGSVVVCLIALALCDSASAVTEHETGYGPYCGLRSIYAALRYEGAPADLSSFVKQKYVGSFRGSSLGELETAVHDAGYYSLPLERITPEFLRDLRHPLVLHVSHAFNTKSYDHYVVCLRSEGDRVRVFDPPGIDSCTSKNDAGQCLQELSSHPCGEKSGTTCGSHHSGSFTTKCAGSA